MKKSLLITGGAGFIGSNLAWKFAKSGYSVTILDDFSRPGIRANERWLQRRFPRMRTIEGSITNASLVNKLVRGMDIIFHLAGQTAVTTSVDNPRLDFATNALGTFNILEAARLSGRNPIVIYASTNKVYGQFKERLATRKSRYQDLLHPRGIAEDEPLDFHSPYGCSKGAADAYTLDYARIYGLPTVVLRQSCIYGPRQFGIHGQGWIAYLTTLASKGKPITIYGSGKQVRDVLFVSDLVKLYELIIERIDRVKGEVFNIGGGEKYTISLLELIVLLERKLHKSLKINFAKARPGDQEVYISDISKAKKLLGWEPEIGIEEGIERLIEWVRTM